ncbi:MAG: hypothetical protein WBZ01_09765, partial [Terriglobales bacterium]
SHPIIIIEGSFLPSVFVLKQRLHGFESSLHSYPISPSSAWAGMSCWSNYMAKSKKFDLENPAPVVDDEDEETLAAIDEGIRDAEAGRTVPAEEVRRLLLELHAHQDALVQKGLEEMRAGRVVRHEEVAKRLKR